MRELKIMKYYILEIMKDTGEKELLEQFQKDASSLKKDKNRIAKAIGVYLRNKLEVMHDRITDDQMKELNIRIRNAIFSFLTDYGNDYTNINSPIYEDECGNYILTNTIPYLEAINFSVDNINEYGNIIVDYVGILLEDLSKDGLTLLFHENFFVPVYWEDCVYVPHLKS